MNQNKINDLDYRKFNLVQTIQKYTRVARKSNKVTYSTIDVKLTNFWYKEILLSYSILSHQDSTLLRVSTISISQVYLGGL